MKKMFAVMFVIAMAAACGKKSAPAKPADPAMPAAPAGDGSAAPAGEGTAPTTEAPKS